MSLFKKERKVFGLIFIVRVMILLLSILIMSTSGTILMADWVVEEDDTNDGFYHDNNNVNSKVNTQRFSIQSPTTSSHLVLSNTNDWWQIVNGGDLAFWTHANGTTTGPFSIGFGAPWHSLRILSNGNVGIGTSSPSYKLDVAGNIRGSNILASSTLSANSISANSATVYGTVSAYDFYDMSDLRYKKSISPYTNALNQVLGLNPVTYYWRTDKFKEKNITKDKQIGLIAQDVEKIIPELVSTDKKGYKSISYAKLSVIAIQALKELKSNNDSKFTSIEKENKSLKQDIAALKVENATLKQKLAKLESLSDRLALLEKEMNKQNSNRLAKR